MNLRSLGYKTDLLINEFENRIVDRGSYIVLETLDNPEFFWGNLLIFDQPPREGDLKRWRALFAQEFAHQPRVRHCTLAWDSVTAEKGQAQDFVAAGFLVEESVVLTTQKVQPPPHVNSQVEVRPLLSDLDWQGAFENQIACRGDDFSYEMYAPFKTRQMQRYRRMSEAGLGHWYGAFLDGRLVGDLGVFVKEGLGRYQSVGTHPEFRRLGICGTLVWKAALHAMEHFNVQTLVMVADPNYHAARVYESVGFQPTERQIGAYWWPKEEWSK